MQPQDRTSRTPPEITSNFIKFIRSTNSHSRRNSISEQDTPSNPRLFVIHSHGCSAHNGREKVFVKVPIVTAAKDGQVHTRIRLDAETNMLNPPIIDSITSLIRKNRTAEAASSIHSAEDPVAQVFKAARDMITQGYTKSNPERYNIGDRMDDIRLFCSGSALFDGIYAVDLKTYKIQPVAKSFGLTTIADSNRQSSRHMSPMEQRHKELLWAEHTKLMAMKQAIREKIREKNKNDTLYDDEISQYARKVAWYNNTRLAKKHVIRESRIKDPSNTCILLSKLIDVGIAKKIVKSTDCFIVFACRTHHDEAEQDAATSRLQPAKNMGTPATDLPSKRDSHSRREDTSTPKRQRFGGSSRKRSRKLNKKTRRVKIQLNKTKSRKRKI